MMNQNHRCCVAIVRAVVTASSLWLFSFQALSQISIQPPIPKSQDTIVIQVPGTSLPQWMAPEVSMVSNQITLLLHESGTVDGGRATDLAWAVGQFPSGDYRVDVKFRTAAGSESLVASQGFTVQPRAPRVGSTTPLTNYTDLWWNPSESGWGLTVHHHPSDVLFLVWFVYGTDSKPTWYVVPTGRWTSQDVYVGDVYRTTGPFFGNSFDPNTVSRMLVGQASIRFLAYDSALLSYTIDGVTGSKRIVRQSF